MVPLGRIGLFLSLLGVAVGPVWEALESPWALFGSLWAALGSHVVLFWEIIEN